jgi:hypothetical protein
MVSAANATIVLSLMLSKYTSQTSKTLVASHEEWNYGP